MGIGAHAREIALMGWLPVLALSLCLERWRPARPGEKGDWLNNGAAFLLAVGAAAAVTPLAGGAATLLVNAAGGGWIALPSRGWGWLGGVAAYLVAMDLGEYLFHRTQHAVPALWTLHSFHHSDPAVNVGTTVRHFWIEPAIKSVTIWLAVGLLFKVPPTTVAAYGVVQLYNLVLHANVRVGFGKFSWLVNSPQYHRLHHSRDPMHFGCNYAALLSIFDLVGGTYRRPSAGEFAQTGLQDRPPPAAIWEVFAWPLAVMRTPSAAEREGSVSKVTA